MPKFILPISAIIIIGFGLSFKFLSASDSINDDAIAYAVDIAVDESPQSVDKAKKAAQFISAPLEWEEIENGIDYTYRRENLSLEISPNKVNTSTFSVYIVRIDPNIYNFSLYGAFLEEENTSFSLPDWGAKNDLLLGINASMYLPDNLTSTGHMRAFSKVNNRHIAQNMGGFFLTAHKNTQNYSTLLLEKSDKDWQKKLADYDIAIQNFRILGSNTGENSIKTLWHYTNRKHAIAAYGQDFDGKIYFILSQNPTTVYELGQYLLALADVGVDFKTVLYAEGGREAALYIKTNKKELYVTGINNSVFNFSSTLPNIIGVKQR